MSNIENKKSSAWDLIGNSFWRSSDAEGRPSEKEIKLYCNELNANSSVIVIGASTYFLIRELLEAGHNVTVFDFSKKMCDDLKEDLVHRNLIVHLHDITSEIPSQFIGKFDCLLADRLINRMGPEEVLATISNMRRLIKLDGSLRLGVKMGLYPMDVKIIEDGKKQNILNTFYDEKTNSIDYSKVGTLLDTHIFPHGDQPIEKILKWYRARGREKRFSTDDIRSYAEEISKLGFKTEYIESIKFPDTIQTVLHVLKARPNAE